MTGKMSFSQSGEDHIIDFIFDTVQVVSRRFLDIGAHDATYLSNTYYFYEKGFTGVCVEPDPVLCKAIKAARPKDTCLAVGIGNGSLKRAPFYIMDPPTLNTFSKKEASIYQKFYPWSKIVKKTSVRLVDINSIIRKYFKQGLDILSVDTEGMDLEIIKSIDFTNHKPRVICVETAIYSDKRTLSKNHKLIHHLLLNGYFVYADTFVNTIFVNDAFWKENNGPVLEGFSAYN